MHFFLQAPKEQPVYNQAGIFNFTDLLLLIGF